MNKLYIEHANITVDDLTRSTHFFQTAFPHFHIRGEGESFGRKWIHLGDEATYFALNQKSEEKNEIHKNYASSGVNHLGIVVDHVAEIASRLISAGYTRSFPKQVEQFRIRDYFFDSDGNEFEFVEYLSENATERNLYDQ